jgi:predicted  nucleic acid-binding Zn-ribbon protein
LNASATESQERIKTLKNELDALQQERENLHGELKRVSDALPIYSFYTNALISMQITADRDDALHRIQSLAKSNKSLESKNSELSLELVKIMNAKVFDICVWLGR